MKAYQLILNTCPDEKTAETIASLLVDQQLVACVNILPGVRSIYQWQGKRYNETECLLLMKVCASAYPEIEALIKKHHPYDIPEILAINIEKGLPEYLTWIHQHSRHRGLDIAPA